MLRPRGRLVQNADVCEDEFLKSRERLTNNFSACIVGSSQKTFLLIDPDCFEVNRLCFVAFNAQQLQELGYRDLFESDRFVESLRQNTGDFLMAVLDRAMQWICGTDMLPRVFKYPDDHARNVDRRYYALPHFQCILI